MKSIIKLGSLAAKASSKKDGANPYPREIHEGTIREKIMTMLCTSVQVARMETITDNIIMQTTLSSCVGAASVKYDQAQASVVIEHDKMIDSLGDISTAVAN